MLGNGKVSRLERVREGGGDGTAVGNVSGIARLRGVVVRVLCLCDGIADACGQMLCRGALSVFQGDGRHAVGEGHATVGAVDASVAQRDREGEVGLGVRLPHHRLRHGEVAVGRRLQRELRRHRLLLDDGADHVLEVLAVRRGVVFRMGRILAVLLQPSKRVGGRNLHIGRRGPVRRCQEELRAGSHLRDRRPIGLVS